MHDRGFQVFDAAPEAARWRPTPPLSGSVQESASSSAATVPVALFDPPLLTKSFQSWRDIDGVGPFLVQKRTAVAVENGWANSHVDRWHFRIVHVLPDGRDSASGGNAALQFVEGGPFTAAAGHAAAEAATLALWGRAKKHIVAIADNEPDVRLVWHEISIRVGAVGFELASWHRAAGHLVSGLFPGPPSVPPSLVTSRSVATPRPPPRQSSMLWSEVPDNSSMFSTNAAADADQSRDEASGAVAAETPQPPLPLGVAATPTPVDDEPPSSCVSGPMARCSRADRTVIALERSLLFVNRHAELAVPVESDFMLSDAARRPATAGRIALSPEGRALVWCDLHSVHTVFFRPSASAPFGSFADLAIRNLRAFAAEAALEPVAATTIKPPLRTLDRGRTIYTAAKYHRHGEAVPGCRIIRRATGDAQGDFVVNLPGSVREVHDIVVSRSGETIAVVFEDPQKNWNVAVVVSKGRHGPISDATDPACTALHEHDQGAAAPLLRMSADGERIALALQGGTEIVMLHLRPKPNDQRPRVAQRVTSPASLTTSSAIVDFMFAPDGVSVVALCEDIERSVETFVFDHSRRVDDVFNADCINGNGLRDLQHDQPLSFDMTPDMRTLYVLVGSCRGDGAVRVRCVDTASGRPRGEVACEATDFFDPANDNFARYSLETAGTVMLVQGPTTAQLFDLYASRTAHRTARDVGHRVTHVAYSVNGAYVACIDRGRAADDACAKVTVFDVDIHGTATHHKSTEIAPPYPGAKCDVEQLAFESSAQPACTYMANNSARMLPINPPDRELLLGRKPSMELPPSNFVPYPTIPVHDVRALPREIARPELPVLLESAVVAGRTVVITTYASGDTATPESDRRRAGKIFHPHVIEYLGPVVHRRRAATTEGAPSGLAFEILDGTLRHALTGWQDLTLPQVLGLIAQVADAVDAMASEGYAHGNIDLDTILVLDRDRNRSGQVGNWLAGDTTLVHALRAVPAVYQGSSHEAPASATTPRRTRQGQTRVQAATDAASALSLPGMAAQGPSPPPSTVLSAPATDAVTATLALGNPVQAGAARLRLVAKLTNYVDPVAPGHAPPPRPLTDRDADSAFVDRRRKTPNAKLLPPSVAGDVYSLAVVLFASVHCLKLRSQSAGSQPQPEELLARAAHDEWNHVYCDGFSPQLKTLVDDCVKREPAERPTPRQFCERLNAALFADQQQEEHPPRVAPAAAFRLPHTPAVWGRLRSELQPPSHLLAELNFVSSPDVPELFVSEPVAAHRELHEHVVGTLLGTPSPRYEQAFDFGRCVVRFIDCVPAAFNFERFHQRRVCALQNNTALWVQQPTTDTVARRDALGRLDCAVADCLPPEPFAQSPQTWRPPQPRIVLAWRAEESACVAKICRDGLQPLAKRDPGFFGHGLYFTLEAAIAATYTANMAAPCLMLYAVSIAQPYPVTLAKDYNAAAGGVSTHCGAAITGGFDAHFIPVRNWGTTNPLDPASKFEHSVHFQAATVDDAAGNTPDGHELCVASSDQCVPLLYVAPALVDHRCR